MLSQARAFDASEHLKAVGVLWGLLRSPDSHTTADGGTHLGFVEWTGNPPPRYAVLVTPREEDPCVIDQISSLYQAEATGYLSHAVIDLKRVEKADLTRGQDIDQFGIWGDKLVCDRVVSLPSSLAPSRTDIECRGMDLWDIRKEEKAAVMAALLTINQSCPLPGFQP